MSQADHNPQESTAPPGYFSPAAAPPGAPAPQPAPSAPPPPSFNAPGRSVPFAQAVGRPDPRSEPLPGVTFLQAVGRFYGRYATFSGRASRSEFWWIAPVLAAVFSLGGWLGAGDGPDWVAGPYAIMVLGSVVPSLALVFRRLHDANLSGGLAFLSLLPYIGWLVVCILTLMPGNPQGARYDKRIRG